MVSSRRGPELQENYGEVLKNNINNCCLSSAKIKDRKKEKKGKKKTVTEHSIFRAVCSSWSNVDIARKNGQVGSFF